MISRGVTLWRCFCSTNTFLWRNRIKLNQWFNVFIPLFSHFTFMNRNIFQTIQEWRQS